MHFRRTSEGSRPSPDELTARFRPLVEAADSLLTLRDLARDVARIRPDWPVECPELYAAYVARRLVLVGTPPSGRAV